jgi:hypothetical protein
MPIKCRTREFKTYEDAEAYASQRGGAALSMPGGRFLAISASDCERIDEAGGPETARFIGRRQRGGIRTIAVGR